jgi:hypothetical protein
MICVMSFQAVSLAKVVREGAPDLNRQGIVASRLCIGRFPPFLDVRVKIAVDDSRQLIVHCQDRALSSASTMLRKRLSTGSYDP